MVTESHSIKEILLSSKVIINFESKNMFNLK